MNDIEKAARAMKIVFYLLQADKKGRAIYIMEMAYQCDPQQATEFVEVVEDIYDVGN